MNLYLPFLILTLAGGLYLSAFLCHLVSLRGNQERARQGASVLVRVGFLVHTLYFVSEPRAEGFLIPVAGFGQVMAFFTWALAFVYLVLLAGRRTEAFGLILTPLLCIFMVMGLARFHSVSGSSTNPMDPYFVIHLGTVFFASACFTLSFAASVLYLFQHRALKRKRGGAFYQQVPPLEVLDGLIFPPMAWGVFLLVLAVGTGFLWAKSSSGSFWFRDPKTVSTLCVTFFYSLLLFLHYGRGVRGKQIVVWSLFAFGFIFLTFFTTSLIGGVWHPPVK